MCSASGAHRLDDRCIDTFALLGEFGDRSQGLSVGSDQFVAADAVCPFLERCGAFGPCLAHGVHHPERNFLRAGIAWMIAKPSSSVTTPTSRGAEAVDGPMNIVTSGSSVSKARQ